MAPLQICKKGTSSMKDQIKVKKPAMEKRRRDRINRSIDQLKLLLTSELQAHLTRSKLEKADILEMTVLYLKKRQTTQQTTLESPSTGPGKIYTEGFNRCLEETLCFFTAHTELKDSQVMHMTHRTTTPGGRSRQSHGNASSSEVLPSSSTIRRPMWRPW